MENIVSDQEKLSRVKGIVPPINHVGGINEQLGGVDPDIDGNLMRLSGGP